VQSERFPGFACYNNTAAVESIASTTAVSCQTQTPVTEFYFYPYCWLSHPHAYSSAHTHLRRRLSAATIQPPHPRPRDRPLRSMLARKRDDDGKCVSNRSGMRSLVCVILLSALAAAVCNMSRFVDLQRSTAARLRLTAILKAADDATTVRYHTAKDSNVKVDEQKVRDIPSRFDVAWNRIAAVRTKTLKESSNRILYSPTSVSSTDGIGHAMSQVNAEVTTALVLGITYTHRVATYASVTSGNNTSAVENFFGWGRDEIPRSKVQQDICNITEEHATRTNVGEGKRITTIRTGRTCPLCRTLRNFDGKSSDKSTLHVSRVVDIPAYLSYPIGPSCKVVANCVAEFMDNINGSTPNTLFRMTEKGCGSLSSLGNFGFSAPWFYTKYWAAHGVRRSQETGQWLPREKDARDSIAFPENELAIAVHVRRGDFLVVKNRRTTKSEVFARVIKTFLDIVQMSGGKFAKLPVSVYIYSEGRPLGGAGLTHDIRRQTHEFVDTDGEVRNASWWEDLISRAQPRDDGLGHAAGSMPQLRVKMRISTNTLISLHEMIAADLFIGSDSGMSWNVVGSLGRGVQLHARSCQKWHCFDNDTGKFYNRQLFLNMWGVYVEHFAAHVP
jgi:hypothetical protein